jgi:hypothetical protein
MEGDEVDGDVSLINEGRNSYKILEGRHHLGDQSIDGRRIFNIFRRQNILGS